MLYISGTQYPFIHFSGYDTGKKIVFGNNDKDANIFARFFFAQFVVSTSETISYPLDTIRRRLMMQSGRKEIVYTVHNTIYYREPLIVLPKFSLKKVCRVSSREISLIFGDQ